MVVFDNSALVLLFNPKRPAPNDPKTNEPVTRCQERIEYLVKTLSERRTKVGIPTPVLAEYLIGVGPKKQDFLTEITANAAFSLLPFDEKAAVELAILTESGVKQWDIKSKVRFDRQVVAIAKTTNATALYTADEKQGAFAEACGIRVIMVWDIPLPPPETASLFGVEPPEPPATSSATEPQPPSSQ
ncbi:MAG TPA: hypothetical protein VKV24_15735 [Casimicrobiaceae bacterium]|nr:hypothetical protein [Casimicrobiaceae bacterium]